ncbi:MAG: radical SAM family heme chaperone HemW [Rhodobacteraceae bacterium]|nr:radical SAM family heme chaperone HemW [Paracoccaceae bacterium]
MDDWQHAGFGVYIHWPFCMAKCPYCDFNSHVRQNVNQTAWREAILAEIRTTAALTGPRRVDTVFFGGGTPSLMPPETIAAIISEIDAVWGLKQGAEISMEANPTSVEAGRFAAFSDAGINRLSMGIQALNDADLKALGRMHTAREAVKAFDIAKKYFENVSFDLIYARQNQNLFDWQSELKAAIDMAVDHLSLYQLTIENGTRFGQLYQRGKLRDLPDENTATDMYFATQEICENAGMAGYETSNHARNHAQSQHNLIYWRYGDYAGIGPGAHGRLTIDGQRIATSTYLLPEKWLSEVEKHGHGRDTYENLSKIDQSIEYLMMSMRLSEGSDLRRYANLAGEGLQEKSMLPLLEDGLIENQNGRLQTTIKGRPLLNAILRELL